VGGGGVPRRAPPAPPLPPPPGPFPPLAPPPPLLSLLHLLPHPLLLPQAPAWAWSGHNGDRALRKGTGRGGGGGGGGFPGAMPVHGLDAAARGVPDSRCGSPGQLFGALGHELLGRLPLALPARCEFKGGGRLTRDPARDAERCRVEGYRGRFMLGCRPTRRPHGGTWWAIAGATGALTFPQGGPRRLLGPCGHGRGRSSGGFAKSACEGAHAGARVGGALLAGARGAARVQRPRPPPCKCPVTALPWRRGGRRAGRKT